MNVSKTIVFILGLTLCATVAAATVKGKDLPEVTVDGLHRVHDSKLAIVYVEPGADLVQYQRVQLLDAQVAFKKNWARDQRSRSADRLRVTSSDVEKIKNDLALEFNEVFKQTLEEGGYAVVDQAGDDVLLIRPAIINLDVNAPDTMSAGRSRTYTKTAGEMTLYIELYDSVTGDLIAKAMDRQIDNPSKPVYSWTNSVTNKAAAKKILKGWADVLLGALNEAKQ